MWTSALRLSIVATSAALVVAACGPAASTPSPTPSPSPSPSPSPTAEASAALHVTADGTVECRGFPHGCMASFIIEPGAWTPPGDWEPTDQTPDFGVHPDPWELDGQSLLGGPTALAPGDYTFGIAIVELNDIVGDPDRYLETEVLCTEQVTIPVAAVSVTVHANFDAPCSIDVSVAIV